MGAGQGSDVEGSELTDRPEEAAYIRRLLADLETLSRACTELSERETRLLDGCRTAWHCLHRAGPLTEREQWARDVLVQTLGGHAPTWTGPYRPFDAARAFIGGDYPEQGWTDGVRPQPATSETHEVQPHQGGPADRGG